MHDRGDNELLAEYVRQQSQEAFAALVTRHVNLVYSIALRHVSDPHEAEDIAQVVFLLLAKKAGSLSSKTVLSGWLYRTAQLTAANHLRMEKRRKHREQEAYMQSLTNEPGPEVWPEIAPALDDAMARLGERERNAVILRFFEGKSLKEVGDVVGVTEAAVQKSVERALAKLRGFFTKRGVVLSAAALSTLLSVNSVQAAPPGLANSIMAASITKGVSASGTTALLMKSTLKLMAWLKFKTAAKVAAWVVVIAGTATVAVHASDYIKLGRAYLFKGEYGNAITKFDQALQLDPQSTPAHFGRARANKLEGNYEQALRDYTRTIQLDPKAVAAYVNRGQIYHLEGDQDRAIQDFNQAIELDPNRPIPFLDRGVAYAAKGDYKKAVADFNSAIKVDPDFSPAYNNLAWQLATCPVGSIRDGKKAIEYATKACNLSQWNNLKQISTLAAAYAEAGDFDDAVKWETTILDKAEASPEAAAHIRERLALYQDHQPYHRPPVSQSSNSSSDQ